VRPSGRWIHRQPTGDWLTSPQWEEWIENPLTFLTFFTVQTDRGEVLFASKQNTLALVRENAVEVVLFTRDAWDEDAVDRRATLDSAVALLPADATNLDRLVTAARAFLHPLHPSLATRNGLSFASIQGPAFVTCVRKEGEDVEVRLFETEGSAGEALLEFPWHVESATRVNLVGAEDGDLSPEFEDRRIALPLRPHQIVTLRIRFQGIRTQYPDIDRYRDVWVG
jgi:alpha-mannosidase